MTDATVVAGNENQSNDFEFSEQMVTKATELNFDEQEIVKMDFEGTVNSEVNSSAANERVELLVMSIGFFKLDNNNSSKLILNRVLIDGGSTHSWIKQGAITNC